MKQQGKMHVPGVWHASCETPRGDVPLPCLTVLNGNTASAFIQVISQFNSSKGNK
jgi:hypothetical protein